MCIEMGEDEQGDYVRALDFKNPARSKQYNFNYAIWGHDRQHSKYLEQFGLYDKLAKPMLQRALEGTCGLSENVDPSQCCRVQRVSACIWTNRHG